MPDLFGNPTPFMPLAPSPMMPGMMVAPGPFGMPAGMPGYGMPLPGMMPGMSPYGMPQQPSLLSSPLVIVGLLAVVLLVAAR